MEAGSLKCLSNAGRAIQYVWEGYRTHEKVTRLTVRCCDSNFADSDTRNVNIRLPGQEKSDSHGAKLVY